MAKAYLVDQCGYPAEVLTRSYDPAFAVRVGIRLDFLYSMQHPVIGWSSRANGDPAFAVRVSRRLPPPGVCSTKSLVKESGQYERSRYSHSVGPPLWKLRRVLQAGTG
jgi:hypothetical protein